MPHRIFLTACLALCAAALTAQTTLSPRALDAAIRKLDTRFAASVTDFNLPSLAVAIVHDGRVVFAKGYGVRSTAGETLPADGQTLYAVASNTKAFTAAALARQVDAGKLAWNDRVRELLPWFELYDPWVTDALTVKDLVTHRMGLATFSGDLLWYGSDLTREEVLRGARHLEPTSGFRTDFGYSNLGFMAAGEVLEEVAGKPWEVIVREELLRPAGMSSACLSVNELAGRTNVALPHNEVDGRQTPIDWVNWDNMAPAGSLLASAEDMARWMILQLDSGRVRGGMERVWDAKRTREMWTLTTPQPVGDFYRKHLPSMHFRGYGMGWELYDLHGRLVVAHSGGYDGMISRQVLVPEEKLGIFIVTNTNTSVPWGWGHDALGTLLGAPDASNLLAYLLDERRKEPEEKRAAEAEFVAARIPDAPPSLPLSGYAGTYTDPAYGDIFVDEVDGKLTFRFSQTPLFHGRLEPWHFDTFRLFWGTQMMLPPGLVTFTLDATGAVDRMEIVVENPDFDFTELKLEKK